MGGPAHQAGLLSGHRFDPDRYETVLVHGALASGEMSLANEAESEGARMIQLPSLVQPVSPVSDARALGQLVRLVHRFRPQVVHTHLAKAGLLGRLAAILGLGRKPILVHTFHGHVLEDYFGRVKSGAYLALERAMGKHSDALIGVSQATVNDLVRLGVAPPDRFRVIPLGLDLERFNCNHSTRGADLRYELGLEKNDILCTFVGRIVPIKRLDWLIEAVAAAHRRDGRIKFLIVGDGDERGRMEAEAEGLGLGDAVHFVGYKRDLVPIWAATDVAVLGSANEGTPVSLIEAAASGVPAVSTDVGGVRETLGPGSGTIVPVDDMEAFVLGILELAADEGLRVEAGSAARRYALSNFGAQRLIDDVDSLYGELLDQRG